MCSLQELKDQTKGVLEFLKYIIEIGEEPDILKKLNKKYGMYFENTLIKNTQTHMLVSDYSTFKMSYRYYHTLDEEKYQNGIGIHIDMDAKGIIFIADKFLRINGTKLQPIDVLDDADLLSLSTLFNNQEIQEIYVISELKKIENLYAVCITSGFVKFLNEQIRKQYIEIKLEIDYTSTGNEGI